MSYYFAYGGNTNPIHMNREYPNAEIIEIACLPDFKLIFQSTDWYDLHTVEQSYCNIIPKENSNVYGVVYKLTQEEEQKLDTQEHVPYLYKKIDISVSNRNVYTYVMNTSDRTERMPTSRYYKVVSYGYTYHKLPFSQINLYLE